MRGTPGGWLGRVTRHLPLAQRLFSRAHARLFRATGGRFLRRWFGMPVLVLEVAGRRTGELRRNPVIYIELDGDPIVIAAAGGSDWVPQWWLNLEAAGTAVVEIGDERRPVEVVLLEGSERDRAWRAFAGAFPTLEEYARSTDRRFPVVRLAATDESGRIGESSQT